MIATQPKPDSIRFKIPERGSYNFKNINLDDPRPWILFQSGRTKGLFQVESPLGQQWCKIIKPGNIDELAALLSLIRPGGLEAGMADKYAKIKHGQEEPTYIHESLRPILDKTYSCLVFQEQILEICVKIAGFNEVEADLARRAVGKKLPEEMIKVETMFIEGCKKTNIVDEKTAKEIFSWIQKSVRYLFNAGHAYSYAYISAFQAFQKKFFPVEFYAGSLNYSAEKVDPKIEIYELIQDATLSNIKVVPPDLKRLNSSFEIIDDHKIAFGIGHIRGVGDKAVQAIQKYNKFDTFENLLNASRRIKRNVAESLVKSGACDHYKLSRTYMLKVLQAVYGHTLRADNEEIPSHLKKLTEKELLCFLGNVEKMGIYEAFKSIIGTGACVAKRVPVIQQKLLFIESANVLDTNKQKALWERLYLGISLTASAADDYEKADDNIKSCKESYFINNKEKITLQVVVDDIIIRKCGEKSKNAGREFAFVKVSDNSGSIPNLVIWPDLYEEIKDDLNIDSVCCIYARKDSYGGRDNIVAQKIKVLG